MDDAAERRRSRMREKLNQQKAPQRRRPAGDSPSASKKDASLFGKRALALGMLAPMLLPILPAAIQMLTGGMKQFRRTKRFRNVFMLLWVSLLVCAVVKQFRSSLKYVAFMLLLVCLYPTWQVYQCSPRHMLNSDIGTLYSIKQSAVALMDDAHYNDPCVMQHMRGPTSLSLINPLVTLQVSPFDIVRVDDLPFAADGAEDEDSPPPSAYKRYLFTSKRSVNKVIHILSLLVEAPSRFTTIDDASQVEAGRAGTSTLHVTGRMVALHGSDVFALKKRLEKEHYIVRPVVFRVSRAHFEEGEPQD